MRARSLITILIFLFVVWGHTVQAYTLVIDPGHGGKDPGAVGKRSYEKNLNLTLAKKVGEKISSQYADVKVVYTRFDDTFVPLQQRADIANSNHADLFLSIHTNSSESKEPKGLETFILGTDKMEKNLDVAMRENAVMMLESDYKTRYQGFDPNSIDSYIMFELMQNSYLDQSLQFATLVQQECVKRLQRYDRGVRQAAFWVLLKTACPSILFEMGFVSSPEEERVLLQDDEMDKMAQAIAEQLLLTLK
jgi:N-acetylmuramoyl-L-alanine amidase